MENCIFCKIANKEIPGKYVYEDDVCVAFLDLAQATKGHTLVVPKVHVDNFLEADPSLASHLFEVASTLAKQIVKNLNATGCNILSNANASAGQTVMHMHVHIIPRYSEDKDKLTIAFTEHGNELDLDEVQKQIIG